MPSTSSSITSRTRLALGAAAVAVVGIVGVACVPTTPPGTTTTTTEDTTPPTSESTTTTEAPVVVPELTVSKTSDLDPAGETVTVTGTNFDTSALGSRMPLSGKPGGAYVVFGSANDEWKPSAGAGSNTRQSVAQRWALPQSSYDFMKGSTDPTYVLIDADGNFTTTLTVSTATAFTKTNVGIYTYGGSGSVSAPNEIFVPVTFAVPEPV